MIRPWILFVAPIAAVSCLWIAAFSSARAGVI